MMKTWLIRRAVRRPVADAVTARISSSVCRLPFISNSPLPSWISSTALAAAASLCAASTISKRLISSLCSRAAALILSRRPDQDRLDDAGFRRLDRHRAAKSRRRDARRWSPPAAPAWRGRSAVRTSRDAAAPRAVSMAAFDLHFALPAAWLVPGWCRARPYDAFACAVSALVRRQVARRGVASTPNKRPTWCSRSLILPGRCRRARSALDVAIANACRRVSASAGSIFGIAARRASGSSSSMENCSRTIALNCGKRHVAVSSYAAAIRRTASKPRSSTARARHADIDQRPDHRFPQAACGDPRFQLGDARSRQLTMQRRSFPLCARLRAAGSMPTAA